MVGLGRRRGQRGPGDRRVELGAGAGVRVQAALQQPADQFDVADPGRVVQQRPGRRAADHAREAGADHLEHRVGLAVEGGHDQHLLRVGVERLGQRRGGPLAAGERRERPVGRRDLGARAELGERRGDVVAVADHGVLVGRPERDAAAPRLAARTVEVGTVRGEQPDRRRAATAPDGVGDGERLVGVGARLEQEPRVLRVLVVERVRERVGAAGLGAVLEQRAQAGGILGLGGVVERLAVVGIGARLEQQARELRVVHHAGGAVERVPAFGSAPRASSARTSAGAANTEWQT